MSIEVFNIKPVALENQKDFQNGAIITLTLEEKTWRYSAKFYAEEPLNIDDKGLGWHTAYTNFENVMCRKAVTSVEKSYMPKPKKWTIYISVTGLRDDIKLYFSKESDTQVVFEKLIQYFFDA